MDVTPQLIEQIDFSEKFRGYDQDQVDDFLERVGATIAELNKSLRDANSRLEDAESEIARLRSLPDAESPAVAPAPLGDEEEMAQAARTLMLARRTADAAIADAHTEAQQILSEAQTRLDEINSEADGEAERLLGTARAEAAEIVRQAATDAEREAAAHRDEVQREVIELDLRRTLLASDVAALEGRMTRYRDSLAQVHQSVGGLLDDPSVLRNEPPHEFVADRPVVETVGYDTEASAPEPEPSVEAPASDDVGVYDVTDGDAATASDEVQVSFDTTRADSGRVDAIAPAPSDPWVPGSWSDAVAAVPEADPVESSQPEVESTGSYGGLSADRYLRDLDEAVNQPVADDDDAMSAFFEGDDTEAQSGRFGRRR